MYLYRIIHVKKLIVPLICIVFIAFLVVFSESSLQSARQALNVWFNTVFPSLLPFLVASEMLRNLRVINRLGVILEPVMRPLFNLPGCSSFSYLLGIVSGYPVGAKITSGMYNDRLITKNEAERLLVISNNAGPLFITGAVATGIFNMPSTGIVLLICHIVSGILTGVLLNIFMSDWKNRSLGTPCKHGTVPRKMAPRNTIRYNPGKAFVEAVYSSVNTMLMVGGFIVFFAVIIGLLSKTGVIEGLSLIAEPFFKTMGIPLRIIRPVLSGIVEITTGISLLGGSTEVPIEYRLAAAAFILGWGGISVHFQVYGIIYEAGLEIHKFVVGKLMHGVLASIITYMCIKLIIPAINDSSPVFNTLGQPVVYNFTGVLLFSCCYMVVTLLIMFLFLLYLRVIENIKKR